jgi:hypothetical protein
VSALRQAERRLFAPGDPRRLAAVRIGLFTLLAWRLAHNDYLAVAGQPATLFDPVSLFKLLSRMPSHDLTVWVQVGGVVVALVAAAGVVPRLSLPLALACSIFLNLMLNSTGKIIHNDVVLTLCLIPLAASPRAACAAWSLPRALRLRMGRRLPTAERAEAYGWPRRTAMVVISLAYLFVGLQKLRYSGIAWASSDNLRWVLYSASDSQASPNHLGLFIAERAWLAHIFAAGTLALEVGFPLCLFFPRLRWLFVPGVVLMHLGIYLTMHLDYSAQALSVIIVFVNWPYLIDKRRSSTTATAPSVAGPSTRSSPGIAAG